MQQRKFRHIIALSIVLAILGGCAVKVNPDPASGASAGYDGPHIQLAQNLDDDELDDDFGDLFPDDDGVEIAEDYDPFETANRFIFAFNEAVDVVILQPAAATYRFLLPEVVRDSVRNVVRNLKAPVIFANELWQGKDDEASQTLLRFGINSTIGLAGLFDVADSFGYEYHSEDFGQTLGVYGAGPGPYIVLPLFGPSSLRDAIGQGVDSLLDPWSYVLNAANVDKDTEILLGRQVIGGLDLRSRNIENLEDLKRDSVDYYARLRSLYLQFRQSEIRDGATKSGE